MSSSKPDVQAKAIHKTATTNELENVGWMYAPIGKTVDIEVPVRVRFVTHHVMIAKHVSKNARSRTMLVFQVLCP